MNIKTIGLGIATLGAIAIGAFLINLNGDQVANDGEGVNIGAGIDISNTSWEEVEAARGAVAQELIDRKSTAADVHAAAYEAASDSYWEKIF